MELLCRFWKLIILWGWSDISAAPQFRSTLGVTVVPNRLSFAPLYVFTRKNPILHAPISCHTRLLLPRLTIFTQTDRNHELLRFRHGMKAYPEWNFKWFSRIQFWNGKFNQNLIEMWWNWIISGQYLALNWKCEPGLLLMLMNLFFVFPQLSPATPALPT